MVHRQTIIHVEWQTFTSCRLALSMHSEYFFFLFLKHPAYILGRQEVWIIWDGDFWLPLESCLMIAGDKGVIIFPAHLPPHTRALPVYHMCAAASRCIHFTLSPFGLGRMVEWEELPITTNKFQAGGFTDTHPKHFVNSENFADLLLHKRMDPLNHNKVLPSLGLLNVIKYCVLVAQDIWFGSLCMDHSNNSCGCWSWMQPGQYLTADCFSSLSWNILLFKKSPQVSIHPSIFHHLSKCGSASR